VPLYLSAGDGRVWASWTEGIVPNESHAVVSLDPATGRVRPAIPGIRGPLAVGWGSVWAIEGEADAATAYLVRLDQTSGEIAARIPLPMAPWHITIGEKAVWILPLEGGNSLIKVDPSTNEVAATIEVPEAGFVGAPVPGGGKLWVPVGRADGTQAIVPLDEDALAFEPAVTVKGSAPFGFSLGRVWILDEEGAVHGLNVSSLEVDVTVSLDQPPAQTAIEPTAVLDPEGDTIWVAKYHDEIARIELRSRS
jgi:virginiamycin B lyase